MKTYKVVCNKEWEFLDKGFTIPEIYQGIATRRLTLEDAQATAFVLNEENSFNNTVAYIIEEESR